MPHEPEDHGLTMPLPSRLAPLVETAQTYARAATSQNTNRAYAADWRDYLGWRARQGLEARPLADPETVGLYLAALASGAGPGATPRRIATIERRLSALVWHFAQRGLAFDRRDRHVATVLAGVRRTHGRPPMQKEALHARASPRHARRPAPFATCATCATAPSC